MLSNVVTGSLLRSSPLKLTTPSWPKMSLTPECDCEHTQPITTYYHRRTVTPQLPPELWLEIFEFATYVHSQSTITPLDPFTPRHVCRSALGANSPSLASRTKLVLVLVSKEWRNIALQLLYRHIEVRSIHRAQLILRALQHGVSNHEPYGQWTRHIEIFTFTRGANDIRYLHAIYKILELCPELRILSGNWTNLIHVDFLQAVAKLLGPSLRALFWKETTPKPLRQSKFLTATTPEFLGAFQSLRTLDLHHFLGSEPNTWSEPPTPKLPYLQDLILSMRPECLKVATFIAMPSLRNLTLQTTGWCIESEKLLANFLKINGAFITTVDVPLPLEFETESQIREPTTPYVNVNIFLNQDLCPILDTISFPANAMQITSHIHRTLRRIGFRGCKLDGLYPQKSSTLRDHLMAINFDKYPRLQVIQIIGFLVDAHAERIARDIFIWWAERFESEMGVAFLDGEAVLWQYDVDQDKIAPTPIEG
ncbi:hypothetical protein JR316_0002439 [Psilocybe cubensis]|uniref:F-box domain-containing protein n=2 Tax=Psilocybe cubensis TaxID=181762 RepID=A0A8H7Y7V9_PSICU|nr:hypothetical protein JR316_0002439 [Psilocybe cubensis]KAH9485529.1 hypothetical protein JR316_0002439 [Psilocybe cubensis]